MTPLYISSPFKINYLNKIVTKNLVFDCRWDCQTFTHEMEKKIRAEIGYEINFRFVFSRKFNDDVICLEVVPSRTTNILEFLNIGYILETHTNDAMVAVPINSSDNYNNLCFHANEKEHEQSKLQHLQKLQQHLEDIQEHLRIMILSSPEASDASESATESSTDDSTEADSSSSTKTSCTICWSTKKNVVFLPCRHLACCEPCGMMESIAACVLCRTPIQQKVKIFI